MFDSSNTRFCEGEGGSREREKGIRGVSVDPIENDSVQSQYLLVKFSVEKDMDCGQAEMNE